jgi:hypothetical protein
MIQRMQIYFTKTAVVLIAFASLAACGGSSSDSGGDNASEDRKNGFTTSAEINTALTEAGLPCGGLTTVPKADREMGTESAVDIASCELDGEDITLIVWKDNGQRDNYTGLGKTLGCSIGEAFGITSFDFVEGDKWQVSGTSATLADSIADKIGGKAVHVKC